jgi:hypothetical protein
MSVDRIPNICTDGKICLFFVPLLVKSRNRLSRGVENDLPQVRERHFDDLDKGRPAEPR